jgi:hypothetical protein
MRRISVAILVGSCACLASCMPIQSVGRSIGWVRPKINDGPKGPDAVFVQVAPLTVPLGDRYANDEVWAATDEQILPADKRVRLQENGLRVGLIVSGRTPDGLQQLLTSKKSNLDPYQFNRPDGGAIECKPLAEMPRCVFPLRLEEQTQVRSFDAAKCRFEIVPSLTADGKVKLVFTPQIEFEDKEKWKRLDAKVALAVQGQRSTENFIALRFEVVLGLNDYVVVGVRYEKPDSLGFKFFVTPDSERPVQRLLAIRAGRLKTGMPPAETSKSALAAQAATK